MIQKVAQKSTPPQAPTYMKAPPKKKNIPPLDLLSDEVLESKSPKNVSKLSVGCYFSRWWS
jgi:hypothetical protein